MFGIEIVTTAVAVEISRAITGRLFTEDQIRSVTKTAIGKYFADLLPEPADERTARERVEEARGATEMSNSEYAERYGRLAGSNNMKAPPSHLRITNVAIRVVRWPRG